MDIVLSTRKRFRGPNNEDIYIKDVIVDETGTTQLEIDRFHTGPKEPESEWIPKDDALSNISNRDWTPK